MLYLDFPKWIIPEVIKGIPIRWYAVMYIVAFAITYILFRYQAKQIKLTTDKDLIFGFFFWMIIGLILGARLLGTTLYDPSGKFLQAPWLIFWPFDSKGTLVGFAGMSYHGGLIGAIIGALLYSKKKKFNLLQWGDLVVYGVPLGYTFGRLGNFINQELAGRVSDLPWAILFPLAPPISSRSEPWVQEIATKTGVPVLEGADIISLPRHPSQLYEGLFEGLVLWLIMWFIVRPRQKFKGQAIAIYLIGYGVARFFIEYTREPDRDLGYIIKGGPAGSPTELFTSFLNISMGQILCFLMILGGVGLLFWFKHLANKEPSLVEFANVERESQKKQRRKTRKKLG